MNSELEREDSIHNKENNEELVQEINVESFMSPYFFKIALHNK